MGSKFTKRGRLSLFATSHFNGRENKRTNNEAMLLDVKTDCQGPVEIELRTGASLLLCIPDISLLIIVFNIFKKGYIQCIVCRKLTGLLLYIPDTSLLIIIFNIFFMLKRGTFNAYFAGNWQVYYYIYQTYPCS